MTNDEKLFTLRFLRNKKLTEVDVMINDLALGVRSDSADILAYRNALKDITEPFKNDDEALSALDIATFQFPEAP